MQFKLQLLLFLCLLLLCHQSRLLCATFYLIKPIESAFNFNQSACESNEDCDADSSCFEGRCSCPWGFVESVGANRCESYKCRFANDCEFKYKCNVTEHLCRCSPLASYERTSQTCQHCAENDENPYQLVKWSRGLACLRDNRIYCSIKYGPGQHCSSSNASLANQCGCAGIFWFNAKEKKCIQILEIFEDENDHENANDNSKDGFNHQILLVPPGMALCWLCNLFYQQRRKQRNLLRSQNQTNIRYVDSLTIYPVSADDIDTDMVPTVGITSDSVKNEDSTTTSNDAPPSYTEALKSSEKVELNNNNQNNTNNNHNNSMNILVNPIPPQSPSSPPSYSTVITKQSDSV